METNMDKSWMNLSRVDPRYLQGLIDFMAFACKDIQVGETEISCPCKNCKNMCRKKIQIVKDHLVVNGFCSSYTVWIFHGERSQPRDRDIDNVGHGNFDGQNDMEEMIRDAFGIPPIHAQDINIDPPSAVVHGPDEETTKFFKLLKEAEQELYPGCQKFSLLSFVVLLMHIKCLSGWSNKSFIMLLKLLKDAFPVGELLPDSFNGCRKLLGGLGLDYHKIHACPKDCMVYWGENINRVDCKVCHSPRFKQLDEQTDGPKKEGKEDCSVLSIDP
jgi:hypothetical protein